MAIDMRNALASWKKAKPLTLTKTGISESLRTLPADPSAKDLPAIEKVAKTIEAAVGNNKIKAEKKALACVTEINTYLKSFLAGVKHGRAEAVKALKDLHTAAHAFQGKAAAGTLAVLIPYEVTIGPHLKALKSATDDALIPTDTIHKAEACVEAMNNAVKQMRFIVTPPTDPSKALKDPKKLYEIQRVAFLAAADKLPNIASSI
jgi:hypothetical protein